VRAVLDALEPDRLEVSDRLTLRGLGRWAGAAGVPSMVIAHERVDGILRAFSPLGARGAQLVADRHNATTAACFDRVVTTTRFAAQEFARVGVLTDNVPLGVDLEQFRPVSRLRGDVPLLVLCSRLSREKRPDLAVEALRELLRGGFPARLVVAGSGPLTASLRRRARGLPVELVGHLSERSAVADLLAAGDVVLAPGPVETFGLAALEALACGTPVVAASTSAVAELVEGNAGRSAKPDAPALAAAVAEVLSLPEARRRGAARARAELFPWSRTTDTMLSLHRLTATRSDRRPMLVEGAPFPPDPTRLGGMAEMSMNKAIHGAFRRDLNRFVTALSSFPPDDVKRGNQLAAAWSNFDDQLTHHHTGEHEIAWPALTAVGVSPSLLDTMDAEHDSMAAAVSDVRAAVPALQRAASIDDVSAARAAFERLQAVTVAHLEHEEAELEPVYFENKDTPEIKAMGRAFGKVSPARGGRFFAWVSDGASPDEMAALRRDIPGPVLAIIGGIFGRGYRKDIAPVWKT